MTVASLMINDRKTFVIADRYFYNHDGGCRQEFDCFKKQENDKSCRDNDKGWKLSLSCLKNDNAF